MCWRALWCVPRCLNCSLRCRQASGGELSALTTLRVSFETPAPSDRSITFSSACSDVHTSPSRLVPALSESLGSTERERLSSAPLSVPVRAWTAVRESLVTAAERKCLAPLCLSGFRPSVPGLDRADLSTMESRDLSSLVFCLTGRVSIVSCVTLGVLRDDAVVSEGGVLVRCERCGWELSPCVLLASSSVPSPTAWIGTAGGLLVAVGGPDGLRPFVLGDVPL